MRPSRLHSYRQEAGQVKTEVSLITEAGPNLRDHMISAGFRPRISGLAQSRTIPLNQTGVWELGHASRRSPRSLQFKLPYSEDMNAI